LGGVSLDSARQRFERRQRDLFRDTAVLERPSGTVSFNTTTGTYDPDSPTQIYSGACLIRGFNWEGVDSEVGGDEVRLRRYRVKFPVDTAAQLDDIVRPTASTYDSSLVGLAFRVTDVVRDGWQISRWTVCEEVTGDA
jgi:hypothetical protein